MGLTLKFGKCGRPKTDLFVEVCLTMVKAESSKLPTIASSFSAFSKRGIAEANIINGNNANNKKYYKK